MRWSSPCTPGCSAARRFFCSFIFFYYGLVVFGISLQPFTAAALTFILNYGAYLTEIYRAGIESVDKGQYERRARSTSLFPRPCAASSFPRLSAVRFLDLQ